MPISRKSVDPVEFCPFPHLPKTSSHVTPILLSRALYICCTSIIPFSLYNLNWFSSIHIRVWLKPNICHNIHLTNALNNPSGRGGHEICVNSCGATAHSAPPNSPTDRPNPPRPPPSHRATPSSPIDNSHIVSTIGFIKVYTWSVRSVFIQKLLFSFCFPNFSLSYRLSRLRCWRRAFWDWKTGTTHKRVCNRIV